VAAAEEILDSTKTAFATALPPPLKRKNDRTGYTPLFEAENRVATNTRNNDTSDAVARGKIHFLSMFANLKCICTRFFILFNIGFIKRIEKRNPDSTPRVYYARIENPRNERSTLFPTDYSPGFETQKIK
jgi:hypothetical protein